MVGNKDVRSDRQRLDSSRIVTGNCGLNDLLFESWTPWMDVALYESHDISPITLILARHHEPHHLPRLDALRIGVAGQAQAGSCRGRFRGDSGGRLKRGDEDQQNGREPGQHARHKTTALEDVQFTLTFIFGAQLAA